MSLVHVDTNHKLIMWVFALLISFACTHILLYSHTNTSRCTLNMSITNSRQNGFISEFFLRFNVVIFGGTDGFSRKVLTKSKCGLFLNLKGFSNVLLKTFCLIFYVKLSPEPIFYRSYIMMLLQTTNHRPLPYSFWRVFTNMGGRQGKNIFTTCWSWFISVWSYGSWWNKIQICC